MSINSIQRFLIYLLILSMATYPIPEIRIGTNEESQLPIGVLLLPIIFFILLIDLSTLRIKVRHFLWIILWCTGIIIPTSLYNPSNILLIYKILTYFFITIVASLYISNKEYLLKTIFFITVVGIILCLYGFYGYLTGEVGLETTSLIWQEEARYWGIHYLPSTRNSDVYYATIPLLTVLSYIIFNKKIAKFQLHVGIILVALFLIAIMLSFSRGAWVSLTLSLIILIYILKKEITNIYSKSFLLILIIAICVPLIYFSLDYFNMADYFQQKIVSIFSSESSFAEKSSNEDRLKLIKSTIVIILENPLGVGQNNLRNHYANFNIVANHPENYYLHILAENSIIGFIGFAIFIFYPIIYSYRIVKNTSSDWVNINFLVISIYLAISYMFNVEFYNLFLWINHSVLWAFASCSTCKSQILGKRV